jgi:hypothetical protein
LYSFIKLEEQNLASFFMLSLRATRMRMCNGRIGKIVIFGINVAVVWYLIVSLRENSEKKTEQIEDHSAFTGEL